MPGGHQRLDQAGPLHLVDLRGGSHAAVAKLFIKNMSGRLRVLVHRIDAQAFAAKLIIHWRYQKILL